MSRRAGTILLEYADLLWNKHDLSAIDTYSSPHGVVHEFPQSGESRRFSIAEIRRRVSRILTEMPDHRMKVLTVVDDDDSVIWSWRIDGTWMLPTGERRRIDITGASVYYFTDGVITRRSGDADAAGLDFQLGRTRRLVKLFFPV